jgi:CheY-like chemotaxis protein
MEQGAQFKVLIVEDDVDTAEIQAAELQDHGLSVAIVNNGNDAVPKMKAWAPHVVILDLELPGKNGIEILHEMKLDPQLRDTLVIGNSIHMDPKDDMGRRFYDSFVYIRQEEPAFVNKLSSDETMDNNLTALIGIELARKFKMLPKALAEYLDTFNKKRAAKGVRNPVENWKVI